jgi:hypothetical protein
MSWSALLKPALVAIALAAAITISVQNWNRLEPALAMWGWLGTLLVAVLQLWMAYDGWTRGDNTRTAVFGIGAVVLSMVGIAEYRRTRRQTGH